jgi:thioredoxin 1
MCTVLILQTVRWMMKDEQRRNKIRQTAISTSSVRKVIMLICLGGVCVPYTAVVPLFILGLKWIVTKFGLARFFPKFVQDFLQLESIPSNKDCCSQAPSVPSSDGLSLVKVLETDEEFEELLKDEAQKVVCKFTSSWCQPCKKIQPFFHRLSTQYKEGVAFRTIDVDDFDEIASKYKVAMMPTFLVLQGEKVLGTYSGSNTNELQSFLEKHAGPKVGK